MKSVVLPGFLLLWLGTGAAQERAPVPQFYAGLKAGQVLADAEAVDDANLFGAELGINFSPKWAFELEYFQDQRDTQFDFDIEYSGFGFNLIQTNRVPLWNPYFLVGLGALRFQVPDDSNTDIMANVAVGGQWDLNNAGLMLRVEARYRYSPVDAVAEDLIEAGEPVVTLELSFPL